MAVRDLGRRRPRRARSDTDDARTLGRRIVSALMLAPERTQRVREILQQGDLEPTLDRIVAAIEERQQIGFAITLPDLAKELDALGGLVEIGGLVALAEIADIASTAQHVEAHARELRALRHDDRERYLYAKLAQDPTDANAKLELKALEERRLGDSAPDLDTLGLSGPRLAALRERPERSSPLPGLFDPEPGLAVLIGKPKAGKTRFALALAQAWACAASPWPGAPRLPGTRTLVVSAEQPAQRIDLTLRQLDVMADSVDRERWTQRLVLIARDPDLAPAARALLTLDDDGLALLRHGLAAAGRARDPFRFVVLDSLARLKPPEIEENDAGAMSAWLARLQEIAEEAQAWLLLLHHTGYSDRDEARTAGRGSSAIAAVAQVLWLLEDIARDPHQRRLRVQGNAVLSAEHHFLVAPDTAKPGEILFFRPIEPAEALRLDELVEPGEELSQSDLAWRIAGRERSHKNERPPGTASAAAGDARLRWAREGLVEAFSRGQSKMLRRPIQGES